LGWQAVKITVDTNVLLRDSLHDDPHQTRVAGMALRKAEEIVIPLTVFCEFVWVLRRGYKISAADIANAIEQLISTSNVVTNRPAVEAGLATLTAGGDFADGVVAFEGKQLGAEEFVSFDAKAVSLLKSQGIRTRLLS
jgi:predicted nucleic-acid-binding protein